MQLDYWQEFVAFSRFMNISQAARHLHISQPTLSNHIAALEKDLGAELISRGKTLRLTPAGRLFLQKASGVLAAYDETLEALSVVDNNTFDLRISIASNSNCVGISRQMLENRFQAVSPTVFLETFPATETSAADELRITGADCVQTCIRPLKEDLQQGVVFESIPVFLPQRLGLWMSVSHPLASKEALSWEDCTGLKFPMTINVLLWAAGVHQILKDHNISYSTRVNTTSGSGSMFALEPDEVVMLDEYEASGLYFSSIPDYCFVPFDEPDAVSRGYLAYRPDKISPGLQLFLDYIRQQPEYSALEGVISA